MSLFQDILKIWRSDDLLSQAWNDSYEMLQLSREFFVQSVKALREQKDNKPIKALKKRDREINAYQRNVRRKVLTHFAIKEDIAEISNGLLLINMVVDIERVGDYAKNILDLAISTPKTVVAEKISKELKAIEDEVKSRFDKTIEAINIQDAEVAKNLMATHKKMVTKVADKLVDKVLSGKLTFGNEAQAASVVLYTRYLKRIASHLTNITTTLVNPLDQIGYTSN